MAILPTSYCFPKLHILAHSQDENFITISFAHILDVYLESEAECAINLLRYLHPPEFQVDQDSLKSVSIETQYSTAEGVPDIVISGTDSILYIEAKVDSGFGDRQLERYLKALQGERKASRYLATLTRYKSDNGKLRNILNLRWYELAYQFEALKPKTDIGSYLKAEFLELLRYRGLTMEAVTWELTNGIRSFRSLVDMLGEAIRLRDIPIHQKSGAWDYYGYYLAKGGIFVGFYLDNPAVLTFETTRTLPNSEDCDHSLGIIKNGKWTHSVDLSSEDAYFFSRSRASQMQYLEACVGDSVADGLKILNHESTG